MTTIDELIEKLRHHALGHELVYGHHGFCGEAAQALSSLQERNRKLEEALTELGPRPWAAYSIINHHRNAAIRAITKALASSVPEDLIQWRDVEARYHCAQAQTYIAQHEATPAQLTSARYHLAKLAEALAEPAQKPKAALPLKHAYVPDEEYPWFCGECGYPEHERLQHLPPPPEAPQDRGEKVTEDGRPYGQPAGRATPRASLCGESRPEGDHQAQGRGR